MEIDTNIVVHKTPTKRYHLTDICVICGFSFIEESVTSSGRKLEIKHFNKKLKLSSERSSEINSVFDNETLKINENDRSQSICIKCSRKVDNILKTKQQLNELLTIISKDRQSVLMSGLDAENCNRNYREKRLISLPMLNQEKAIKSGPFLMQQMNGQNPSNISSTQTDAANLMIMKPLRQQVMNGQTPSNFSSTQTEAANLMIMKPLRQQEMNCQTPSNISSTQTEAANFMIMKPLRRQGIQTARKSLIFEGQKPKLCSNEVDVTVFYPSGPKKTFIWPNLHRKLCTAITNGKNCEKTVIELIAKERPNLVIESAAGIIKQECQLLCKRGSYSLLQNFDYPFEFTWEKFGSELSLRCPGLYKIFQVVASDLPVSIHSKPYTNMMAAAAVCLNGRSREMSTVHYLIGLVLKHGGCTLRTIEILSHLGLSVHPETVKRKLMSWHDDLDNDIISIRQDWENGGKNKYQLIGDNWDKDILPSYRTSDRKTESLHLFNMFAIVDRVQPESPVNCPFASDYTDMVTYLPSIMEQQQLREELTFLMATSLVQNIPQLSTQLSHIYPTHLEHKYSGICGEKTTQIPLGLFDCNENKTQELIQLLKLLSERYVPCKDGELVESVFFGGDRLTDERVQSAQLAMKNADTGKERLEGFISKIEDFHRLMNFLEAVSKLTYSTSSGNIRGTVYYYRNLLNKRDVKDSVKNSYRAYKLLYYVILDAICIMFFMDHLGMKSLDDDVPYPSEFHTMSDNEKINWINSICQSVLSKWFFDEKADVCQQLHEVFTDPNHEENYWTSNTENERVKCHYCEKTYAYVNSAKAHEIKEHNASVTSGKMKRPDCETKDEVQDYIVMLFILTLLHRNLDTAVDMGDGWRSVRSAKYELPIYNKTNKVKYAIGSIHLTALTSGLLPNDKTESLAGNRFVNVQGGKNNNIALDEYLEMLNRDSKIACSGYKTKESIIRHSKEYPMLSKTVKYVEEISEIHKRKGFHNLPSYKQDVKAVLRDLLEIGVMENKTRKLNCKALVVDRNPFENSFSKLPTFICRHTPSVEFHRLRNNTI